MSKLESGVKTILTSAAIAASISACSPSDSTESITPEPTKPGKPTIDWNTARENLEVIETPSPEQQFRDMIKELGCELAADIDVYDTKAVAEICNFDSINILGGGATENQEQLNALGLAMINKAVNEERSFKVENLIIGHELPSIQEWLISAKQYLETGVPMPIQFEVGLGKPATFSGIVKFTPGTAASASISLLNGDIGEITIGVGNGNLEQMYAAFVKESICTAAAIYDNTFEDAFFTAMTSSPINPNLPSPPDVLTTYVDGMAVICLNDELRRLLNVPDYLPKDVRGSNGSDYIPAIHQMSLNGIIHPGGIEPIMKLFGFEPIQLEP